MSKSALVLEGSEVKLRLQAERTAHKTPVHIDWLRFTCLLRNVVPDFASRNGPIFPTDDVLGARSVRSVYRMVREVNEGENPRRLSPIIGSEIQDLIRCTLESYQAERDSTEFKWASAQALELAKECAEALGPDFSVNREIKAGKDFYKYAFVIEREGHACGWVGFLASSGSPSAERQNATIHACIEGHACTFAQHGWNDRLAEIVETHQAKITRIDLALDLFDGGLDMASLADEYRAGGFDVRGRRPATHIAGDWTNGAERSFYVGCRKSGKETNIYEKGDQLFGRQANSEWIRIELRFGNKLRVLDSDMLRRPADFFAGASDWHRLQMVRADSAVVPQSVPVHKRLPIQSVRAEVVRNLRWAFNAAAPTIAAAFKYLSEADLSELCDYNTKKLPGRLRKFGHLDLVSAFNSCGGSGHALMAA